MRKSAGNMCFFKLPEEKRILIGIRRSESVSQFLFELYS
jgi:hypothetical protein